jgi:hypothetical protein
MSGALGSVAETLVQRLSKRVPVIRATDVVLAALQSAFSQPTLLGADNAFRFNRDDPKHSRVWICAPDNRVANERDGARMMITVDRADYVPNELHLHNYVGSPGDGQVEQKDLAAVMIYIRCEAGIRIQSEMLASISYNIMKMFRRDLMKEFDIHSIRLGSISTPANLNDAPGEPWVTIVSVRLELEEYGIISELANSLNRVNLIGHVKDAIDKNIGEIDGDEDFPPVEPLPGFPASPEHA